MLDYENAALKMIAQYWQEYNRQIFGKSMKVPSFQFHEGRSRLGYWQSRFRTISLSKDLVFSDPWYRVLAVLKHEMLHQFVEESMGGGELPPHGEMFQSLRKKFEIEEYEDIGLADAEPTASSALLEKIRKLLSLAQSDELGEAQNAMRMANELMKKWNIEQSQLKDKKAYHIRELGQPGRIMLIHKMLSAILRDFFFVETIWVQSYHAKKAKWGRVLEVTGLKENVEMAEYVYHYLLTLSEQLWKAQKKEEPGSHRGNFLYGIMLGFYEKLESQQDQVKEEKALIWKGDPWLKEFFERRHPRRGQLSGSKMSLHRDSLKAGKDQGKKIVLRKGIQGKEGPSSLNSGGIKGFLN